MKTGKILFEGIEALRAADADIDRLISPRGEEVIALLEKYIAEIELFNPAYGLVGCAGTEELIIKHILDSLAPLGIISRILSDVCMADNSGNFAAQIADAGSGAGLPGIPLAIAMPHCDFTLIERMGRRAGFLWNTKASVGLSNITIEEKDMEKTEGGRFSLVTFRAFKPLEPKLLTSLFKICAKGGAIAAYRGKHEKIEHEMSQFKNSGTQWQAIPVKVPFLDEERHLLVINNSAL